MMVVFTHAEEPAVRAGVSSRTSFDSGTSTRSFVAGASTEPELRTRADKSSVSPAYTVDDVFTSNVSTRRFASPATVNSLLNRACVSPPAENSNQTLCRPSVRPDQVVLTVYQSSAGTVTWSRNKRLFGAMFSL